MKPETVSRRVGRKSRTLWGFLGALAVAGAAVAAVVLFTQTAPPVTVNPQALASNCAALVASPTSVTQGSSGDASFACTGGGAFNVAQTGVSVTPTFALGGSWTDLWAFPATNAPGASCSATTGAVQLASGSAMTFGTGGGWSYCADFASASSLPSFTVSWSE